MDPKKLTNTERKNAWHVAKDAASRANFASGKADLIRLRNAADDLKLVADILQADDVALAIEDEFVDFSAKQFDGHLKFDLNETELKIANQLVLRGYGAWVPGICGEEFATPKAKAQPE